MKKILLMLGVVLCSLTTSAQQYNVLKNNVHAERNYMAEFTQQSNPRFVAPRLALAENQKYMGAYTSDDFSTEGLGLTGVPGTHFMYAELPDFIISAFDGGKVVGMRFAVSQASNTSKVSMIAVHKNNSLETLIEAPVSSSKIGWNVVDFGENAFTLDLSDINYILMGYNYVQTSSNFPLAYSKEGIICNTLTYGDLGDGLGYYDIGFSTYGNLCVQAIVEKNFQNIGVRAVGADDMFVEINSSVDMTFMFVNEGTDAVNNISYTITRGGKTSDEETYALDEVCTSLGELFFMTLPLDAAETAGEEDITITVTKVNGQENPSLAKSSTTAKLTTVSKLFPHNVAVEEYTGLKCPWCPRGWQGMENLRETFGDSFVGIALHQYNNSTTASDAMSIARNKYAPLSFTAAPQCMIERGTPIDPFYGVADDIRDDFRYAMDQIAECGVEVSGVMSDDKTTVHAQATIETIVSGNNYNVEFVLIADSLSGTSSNWKQANNYYSYSPAQVGEPDLYKFCNGGQYGQSSIAGLNFNDVAIASSYVNSENQVGPIVQATAYTPIEKEYTLTMPTYTGIVNAIKKTEYRNIYVIALVINRTTGRIVNAAKSKVIVEEMDGGTAINDIDATTVLSTIKPQYNLAGQKVNNSYRGIVIKDGKKILK